MDESLSSNQTNVLFQRLQLSFKIYKTSFVMYIYDNSDVLYYCIGNARVKKCFEHRFEMLDVLGLSAVFW